MSVAGTVLANTWDVGKAAQTGGPLGYFGGSVGVAGNVSGGETLVSIDLALPSLQGLWVELKWVIVTTNDTNVRTFTGAITSNFFNSLGFVGYETKSTVVGIATTSVELVHPNRTILVKPSQNVGDATIFRVEGANIDGETVTVHCMGQYWRDARLRKEGVGPLLSW